MATRVIGSGVGFRQGGCRRGGEYCACEGGWRKFSKESLLHFRTRATSDDGVRRQRGPDIGEATKYWGKEIRKWLVTLVDMDEWTIILLAMSAGKIKPLGSEAVQVTVQRTVGGFPRLLLANRAFARVDKIEHGGESAWPTADFQCWKPDHDDKVRLFVLVYLLSGCDFLPEISSLPFGKIWKVALACVRAEGVFDRSLFVKENDNWTVSIDECVNLLVTMFYVKNEATFLRGEAAPGKILHHVDV